MILSTKKPPQTKEFIARKKKPALEFSPFARMMSAQKNQHPIQNEDLMLRNSLIRASQSLMTFSSTTFSYLRTFSSRTPTQPIPFHPAMKLPLVHRPQATSSSFLAAPPIQFTAFNGNRFFNTKPATSEATPFSARPYIMGPVLTPEFVRKNQLSNENSKRELKAVLDCNKPQQKDLSIFIDVLFDLEKSKKLISNIDYQTQKIIAQKCPELFQNYQKIVLENKPEALDAFFKSSFLPALRTVFRELAQHYGFNSALVETNDGVLLDEDYMDFVSQGKLILDLGEDGHGPFPHIIAAFMMKELEKIGQISSALSLYQSLAERSSQYCPHRANFNYRFQLLLDFPNAYPFSSTQFCNPSSLANHLLLHGKALKPFASICKNHSQSLAKLSLQEWDELENKSHLVRGKVIQF